MTIRSCLWRHISQNNLHRLGVFSLIWLQGCASIDTQLPEISPDAIKAEAQLQQQQGLIHYKQQLGELMDIAWPVLEKNTQLCPKTRPALGVKSHYQRSYPKPLRIASAQILGAMEQPSLIHIIKGSPAERAGLKIGDILLDNNRNPVRETDKSFWQNLNTEVPSVITIRRGDKDLNITVKAAKICRYHPRLLRSQAINAYADGRHITVTSGMMNFVKGPDELALIIGHELAHNSLRHIRKILGNRLLTLNATRFTRAFESEADYVGLYFLVRAGYSPDKVEEFWRRLSVLIPKNAGLAKSHPAFADRFLRLKSAREEIKAKQKDGEVLKPNLRDDPPRNTSNNTKDKLGDKTLPQNPA